jgi:hypothetical protein
MTRGSRWLQGSLVAVGALLACSAPSPPEEPPDPARFAQETMPVIADALTHALPLSLREDQLEDPARREAYGDAVATLARNTAALETHGRTREASFGYLSSSLARDTSEALRRFEAGRMGESQFFVRELVNDCVACHSRLPDPESSALGARLVRRARLDEIEPAERARLQVATRQFDAALDTWEALFRDPSVPPGQLDLDGQLVDYLVVNIRVRGDLRRPQAPLEQLAARPDVPGYLAQDLAAWLASLRRLDRAPRSGALLAEARALVADARPDGGDRIDRGDLVQELLASSLLHRFVATPGSTPAELAEAYYLLGLTETRVRHSAWLSEAEFYLETAVRTDPSSPWAARSFALLEQETLAGYTGSGGLQLPDDVRARLDELRGLLPGS